MAPVRAQQPIIHVFNTSTYLLDWLGCQTHLSSSGDSPPIGGAACGHHLITSEEVKQVLERMGATRAKFKEVTGPSTISAEERTRNRKIRELLETAATAREAAWRSLRALDKEVFMPIAMSGSWPGQRQLWSVIRREAGRTLLVTHGLSDPFIERLESSVGLRLELALEVDAGVKDISKGWLLLLLDRVADEAAEHEHVREGVKAGLFSMEVSGKGMPKSLVTEEGRVAVLLGVESHTLPSHFFSPHLMGR